MPRREQAMKDVASCDKLREPLSSFDPEVSEWATQPRNGRLSYGE